MENKDNKNDMELFCERFPTIYINMFYEDQFLRRCCDFLSKMKKENPEWFKEKVK